MTAQLNDLFHQIIESEKKANERKALLETVKQNIADHKIKLKDAREEYKSLQGQLALKVHQLSENKMQLKLLQNRSKILREQRDAQKEEYSRLVKQKKNVKEELDRNAEGFRNSVEAYSNEYDLTASMSNQREITAQEEIEILKKEEARLLKELSTYNAKQDVINKLKTQLSTLQKDIEGRKAQSKDLEEKINEHVKEAERLEEEKENISNIPQTSPEFQRLNKELETYNEIGRQLDDMCSALQAELQGLKQAKWRDQLQQSRKHKQQQQHCKRGKENRFRRQQESSGGSNFKRIANYKTGSSPEESTDVGSDFLAASALLAEEDAMLENTFTPTPPGGKKPNLSKLTDGLKAKVVRISKLRRGMSFPGQRSSCIFVTKADTPRHTADYLDITVA